MTKNKANGLQITTNPDQEHATQQGLPSEAQGGTSDFATLALHPEWEFAYKWAASAGILDEFFLLLNTTLIREKFIAFGSVLAPLTLPLARDILLEWEQTDGISSTMKLVADAVMVAPEILAKYPPLPTEKKAAVQFRGDIEAFYLMALLTDRLPPSESSDKEWFATLRIWLYRHAIERGIVGNVQDINLRLVSSKLRMASEDGNDWRKFFLLLKTPQREIDTLEAFIIFRAMQLIDRRFENNLTDLQVSVLKALISIARHEDKADKKLDSAIPQLLPIEQVGDKRTKFKAIQLGLLEAEDEDDAEYEGIKRLQFNEDETLDLAQMAVDEQRSLSQQTIYGNSILLYAAEELAHLPWSWNKPNRYELPLLEKLIKKLINSEDLRERVGAH